MRIIYYSPHTFHLIKPFLDKSHRLPALAATSSIRHDSSAGRTPYAVKRPASCPNHQRKDLSRIKILLSRRMMFYSRLMMMMIPRVYRVLANLHRETGDSIIAVACLPSHLKGITYLIIRLGIPSYEIALSSASLAHSLCSMDQLYSSTSFTIHAQFLAVSGCHLHEIPREPQLAEPIQAVTSHRITPFESSSVPAVVLKQRSFRR